MPHLVALGEELRRLRTEAGLSRAALAELALINRATVTNIEHACRRTRRSTLERIALALIGALPARGTLEELVEYLAAVAGPALAPESRFRERVDGRRGRRVRRKEAALEAERAALARAAQLAEQLARRWAEPMAAELVRERKREVDAYAAAVRDREVGRLRAGRDRLDDLAADLRQKRAELKRRERALAARERQVETEKARVTVAPEPAPTPPAVADGPICLRERCDRPAEDGARFCAEHRWT